MCARRLRFPDRLGFEIDAATWDAIRASAPFLTRLSAERIKQELDKTMEQVDRPSRALRMWRETGAAAALLPAVLAVLRLRLSARNPAHRSRKARILCRFR